MSRTMYTRTLTATIVLLVVLAGCSGSRVHDRTVVHIGGEKITNTELTHWMSVLAPGHHVAPGTRDALRKQALGVLISSRWLTAQAGSEGIGITAREVQDQLARNRSTYPGGASEFRESIAAIGRTIPDAESEIRIELATKKIKRALIASEAQATQHEIAAYYKQHIAEYHLPEKRYFNLVENLRSNVIAQKIRREILRGGPMGGIPESQARSVLGQFMGQKRIIEHAIFNAPLNAISKPILINGYYFLLKVTRITAPRVQPLVAVQQAIAAKLNTQRQRRTLVTFVAAWRSRWRARTHCAPGYVIQKCSEYTGKLAAEDQLAFS